MPTRWRCDDCNKSFNKVPLAPMLHDRVWLKLASQDETLCGPCFFARATQRDIRLTLASLRPCRWNLDRNLGNQSWFDLFSQGEDSVEVGMAQGSDGIWEIARSFFVRYGRFASAARTAVLILKTAILSTEISGSVSEISVNFMSYINEL